MEIGERTSAFGSGGMRSKVAAAEMASEAGIPATICNGTAPGTLAAAAAGRASAPDSPPRAGKASSFKLWLKYAKPSHGRLLVDEGAARVLRERGSSLLPVGIIAVEGDFDAGDAVEVAADGEVVGKGIVDYSAAELSQVIGMKSAEVRELLPHAADEVIHRDRFVPASSSAATAGASQLPLADGRDHDDRRRSLRSREARRAGPRQRPTAAKDAALEATARLLGERSPRCSRRTPPTSPTSAPPG